MSDELAKSYRHCQRLARRAASNFYWSFMLLPRAERRSMCALYAFSRITDDLGDSFEPLELRRRSLDRWRAALDGALHGLFDDPLLPALADTVRRFRIPSEHLFDVIDGVAMDLDRNRYETFEELQTYCHRVASAVGLSCIHVWGFRGRQALEPARACGLAFQLTNILRDLKEDALRDRVYLPAQDLRRCDYGVEDLKLGVCDERFDRLIGFQIARAERYYDAAEQLAIWLEPLGRRVLGGMTATYRGLLDEIRRRPADLFTRRIRLGRWQKLRIATRWLLYAPRSGGAQHALEIGSP